MDRKNPSPTPNLKNQDRSGVDGEEDEEETEGVDGTLQSHGVSDAGENDHGQATTGSKVVSPPTASEKEPIVRGLAKKREPAQGGEGEGEGGGGGEEKNPNETIHSHSLPARGSSDSPTSSSTNEEEEEEEDLGEVEVGGTTIAGEAAAAAAAAVPSTDQSTNHREQTRTQEQQRQRQGQSSSSASASTGTGTGNGSAGEGNKKGAQNQVAPDKITPPSTVVGGEEVVVRTKEEEEETMGRVSIGEAREQEQEQAEEEEVGQNRNSRSQSQSHKNINNSRSSSSSELVVGNQSQSRNGRSNFKNKSKAKNTPIRGLSHSMEEILRKRMIFHNKNNVGTTTTTTDSNADSHDNNKRNARATTTHAVAAATNPPHQPTTKGKQAAVGSCRRKHQRHRPQQKPKHDKQPREVGRFHHKRTRGRRRRTNNGGLLHNNSSGSSQLGLSVNSLQDIIKKRMVFSTEDPNTANPAALPNKVLRRRITEDYALSSSSGEDEYFLPEEEEDVTARGREDNSEEEGQTVENNNHNNHDVISSSFSSQPPPPPTTLPPPPPSSGLSYQTTSAIIASLPRHELSEQAQPGAYARAPGMASVRLDTITDAISSLQRQQQQGEEDEILVPTEAEEEMQQEIDSYCHNHDHDQQQQQQQQQQGVLPPPPTTRMDSLSMEDPSSEEEEEVSSNYYGDEDEGEGVEPPVIEAFLVSGDGGGQSQMLRLDDDHNDLDQAERQEQSMPASSGRSRRRQEVPPEDTVEVVQAQKVHLVDLLQNKSIQVFIAMLLVLVVSVSIGSSIAIVLSRPEVEGTNGNLFGGGGNTEFPPPAVPTTVLDDDFVIDPLRLLEELPDYSQARIVVMDNDEAKVGGETITSSTTTTTTPQTKAFRWLYQHPNLGAMTKQERTQNFAMSTFFYSFGGDDWKDTKSNTKEAAAAKDPSPSRLLQQSQPGRDSFFQNWLNVAHDVCQWGIINNNDDDSSNNNNNNNGNSLYGIECNENKQVTKLQINRFIPNFRGVIPPELSLLTDLQELVIQRNQLSSVNLDGFIPTQLKDLKKLTKVCFARNGLRGNVNAAELTLFSMDSIQVLDLSWNKLSGSLPEQVYPTDLVVLDVRQNLLSSTIPPALDQLPLIQALFLQDNINLTGRIDGSKICSRSLASENYIINHYQEPIIRVDNHKVICNATCCEYDLRMDLPPLPSYTLDSIRNDPISPQAQAYSWLEDQFDRRTLREYLVEPWEKEQLLALATFYYSFDGPHWPQVLQGTAIEWLDENHHECQWGKDWKNVRGLHGNWCNIIGSSISSSTTTTMTFRKLDILRPEGDNSFILRGSMPREISLLRNLVQIIVQDVGLNTTLIDMIPTQFAGMPSLTDLNFANNKLCGEIPPSVSNMTNLMYLSLQNNDLRGTIPTQLGTMTILSLLDLENNNLSGSIPTQLGKLSRLAGLTLAGNPFSPTSDPEEYLGRYQESELNDNPTLLAEFVKDVSDQLVLMPLEVCNLTSFHLTTLRVDCAVVACPPWCNCQCSK